MLTSGDMDNNVHMANTMRLADALIKADKRFEMLIFPGMRHPYTPINDYVVMRRMDFFAHWLLGSYDTGQTWRNCSVTSKRPRVPDTTSARVLVAGAEAAVGAEATERASYYQEGTLS